LNAGKRIELLKEAFPAIARVGFMHNMGNPVAPPEWQAIEAAAEALGISVERRFGLTRNGISIDSASEVSSHLTPRWRELDSNHRYPEDKLPLRDGLLSPR
jgi:hypothetical protein